MDTKALEKINKLIDGLEKKIKNLSGNYLTNTPKRQREQQNRDNQKEKYRQHLELMQYFKLEAGQRMLTSFESLLLTGTVYEVIRRMTVKYQRNTHAFEDLEENIKKSLAKAEILNHTSFTAALERFVEITKHAVTPTDHNAQHLRDLLFEARNNQSGDIQFTPAPIAEYLIDLAGINADSKVLEPEAGIASIADEIKKHTQDVDCVEIVPSFREILKLKGHNVVSCNIFEYEQTPIYSAVVMNPPFSAEIEHVKYAFEFLKPGGALVAICSPRFTFMNNRGYPEFKQWLDERGLYFEDTNGKFEKTGMSSVIIKISKSLA